MDAEIRTESTSTERTGRLSLREGLTYAVAAALPSLLSLAQVPLYSRWFSPEVYGYFTIIHSGSVLASSVLLAVFSNALYRYYDESRRDGSLRSLLAAVAVGIFVALMIAGIGVLVSRPTLSEAAGNALAWGFVLFVIASLKGLLAQVNRLEHQVGVFVAGRLIDPLWRLALPAILLYIGISETSVVLVTAALAATSSALVGAMWARRQLYGVRPWEARRDHVQRLLRYGLPLLPLPIASWFMGSADRYMLQWLLGSDATGVYAMGHQMGWMPVAMMSSVLVMVMGPSVWERVNSKGDQEGMALVRRFTQLYLGIAIPGAVGLALLASSIGEVVLGPAYGGADEAIRPLALAAVLGGLYPFLVKPWELTQATAELPVIVGIGAFLSVLFNLWSIPLLGIAGPGWSALLSHGLVASLLVWRARSRFGVCVSPRFRDLANIAVSSALMAGTVHLLVNHLAPVSVVRLVVIVGVGITVYLATWLPFQRRMLDRFRTAERD